MSNPIIYQAAGGLLVVLFFVAIYMCARTWRWPHVTLAVLVFIMGMVYCVLAAMSARTHVSWREEYHKRTIELEQKTQRQQELLRGDPARPESQEQSLQSINAMLGRTLLDRGRVWRNTQPSASPDGTIIVNTAPPGVAEAEAPPNRITGDMTLYAFAESEAPPEAGLPEGSKVPRRFVGEFIVTAATDTSVTLQPSLPITDLGRTGVTWTLYESIPMDSHKHFAENPRANPNLEQRADEEPVFGQMNEERIRRLFEPYKAQMEEDQWEAMVQRYLDDGKQGDRDLPPENVWLKVRFTKEHTIAVDADLEQPLGAVSESEMFFNSATGQAEVPLLQRGEDVTFQDGNVAIFPLEQGDQLVSQGVAEEIEPIYVRSLHNYGYAFRELARRFALLEQDIRQVQRDTEATEASNRRTIAQIQYREEERQKLQEDLAKVNDEKAKVTEYAQKLAELKQQRVNELSRLYRTNQQLADDLARIQEKVTEEVDRRTAEASSSSGAE